MVASCPQDDLADVLSMSQQQDHSNQEVAALAEAVQATRTRRRSSRLANSSSGPPVLSITKAAPAPVSSKAAPTPEPSNSSRWSEAKEVKIVANANTAKADKKAMKAFNEFLTNFHGIEEPDPINMEQGLLKKRVADFITRVSRHSACT